VRFKTFNPIPVNGRVIIGFPPGFRLAGCSLAMLRAASGQPLHPQCET
jgi:hypothetical protein